MKWQKPSGMEIETNDMPETIEYCKSLGWKPMDEKPEPKKEQKKPDKGMK